MSVIDRIYFKNWEDYKLIFENYDFLNKEYIFRGHSNQSEYPKGFHLWKLISSFNRSQHKDGYSFSNYLNQQFETELFRIYYSDYCYKDIDLLTKSSLLHKCYFFQHYGIPTCFIDFTFDPFVALYFALTGITGRSGGAYDMEGNPLFYSDDETKDYISIYKIDVKLLKEVLKIKEIDEGFIGHKLEQLVLRPSRSPNFAAYVGLDLRPYFENAGLLDNFNLVQQKGCFLYYDNEDIDMSFEEFLELYCIENNIKINSPIVTIYNISYNSVFKKMHSRQPDSISLFNFLRNRKVIGKFLFNDIQGLKYDFNFFHNE